MSSARSSAEAVRPKTSRYFPALVFALGTLTVSSFAQATLFTGTDYLADNFIAGLGSPDVHNPNRFGTDEVASEGVRHIGLHPLIGNPTVKCETFSAPVTLVAGETYEISRNKLTNEVGRDGAPIFRDESFFSVGEKAFR